MAAAATGLDTTASFTRTELVRPAMCGHNSLLVGQIGDWTWDAVSAACGTDVLRARDRTGVPTYLSFYYYRIRGGRGFHLRTPTFGDELAVQSRVFGFGSESVLTLHRIGRTEGGADGAGYRPLAGGAVPIDPDQFYAATDDGHLYVETFNRWIARSRDGSNEELVRSSPVGFQYAHLPRLPDRYSPRLPCQRARSELTFRRNPGVGPVPPELALTYEVDPSRDLNGVGLLYFASYFSIVDWALLRLWRELGRTDHSFLERVVVDQQLCYLGNADAGGVIAISARRWLPATAGDPEVVDIVLRERGSRRLLAVCTLSILSGGGT